MLYHLETFPRGWVYAAFIFFAGIFLWRLFRLVTKRRVDSRNFAETRATGFFVMLVSALAAGVIGHYMFLRFHALEIKEDRLELIYYWPRPNAAIMRRDFNRVAIASRRTTMHLLLMYGRNSTAKSARPGKSAPVDRIVRALEAWKIPRQEPPLL